MPIVGAPARRGMWYNVGMPRNTNLSAAKNAKNDEFYTQYADSAEVKRLRDEADVIVTNPPFSLFREFLAWILEGEKEGNEGVSFDRINRIDRIGDAGDGGRGDRESVEKEGDGFNAKGAKGFDAKNAKSAEGSRGASGTPRPTGDIGRARPQDAPPKKFLIIGNMNAVSYTEVFPLIQGNKVWLGATGFSSDMVFAVPNGTQVSAADKAKAERLGYVGDYTRLGNSCWFTNVEHGRRHTPLSLLTMADNIKYSRHKDIRGRGYYTFENYPAIEVPFTDAIPSDYDGVMAVPRSFLDKYCPEQFEIVGIAEGESGKELGLKSVPKELKKLNRSLRDGQLYYLKDGFPEKPFARILIRRRNP